MPISVFYCFILLSRVRSHWDSFLLLENVSKTDARQASKHATKTKPQHKRKMKPTLLLLSVIAIALISCAEARLGCICPAVEPRWCRRGEEPANCGCCGCSCMKLRKVRAKWLDEEVGSNPWSSMRPPPGSQFDNFERPPHTRPQQPTGQSIWNSMWDEMDDEEVGYMTPRYDPYVHYY